MMLKPSQVAADLAVSRDTVYLWIERGIIPADCVIRIGATIRLDSQKLDALVSEGKLRRQRALKLTRSDNAFIIERHGLRTHAGRRKRNEGHGPLLERTLRGIRRLAEANDPWLRELLTP